MSRLPAAMMLYQQHHLKDDKRQMCFDFGFTSVPCSQLDVLLQLSQKADRGVGKREKNQQNEGKKVSISAKFRK